MPSSPLLKILEAEVKYRSLDNYFEWLLETFHEFVVKYALIELYGFQSEVAEAVLKSLFYGDPKAVPSEITAEFARQMGKTMMAACIHAFCAIMFPKFYEDASAYDQNNKVTKKLRRFIKGFYSGIFAPTKQQSWRAYSHIREIVENIIKDKRSGVSLKIDTQSKMKFHNNSVIELFTAKPGSKIESASLHFAHLDEAQDIIDEMIKKSILPMGTHKRMTRLLTGTPAKTLMQAGKAARYFYNAVHDPENAASRYIFDYTYGYAVSQDYKIYIDDIFGRLGTDDDDVRCSYFLDWITGSLSFTTIEKIKELERLSKEAGVKKIKTLMWGEHKEYLTNIFGGLDVAQAPEDTVATVGLILPSEEEGLPRIQILDWLELSGGMSYYDQIPEILEFWRRYALTTVSIDCTGQGNLEKGSLLYQMLTAELNKGRAPQHSRLYLKRSIMKPLLHHELFGKMREMWRLGKILFPADGSREHLNFTHQFEMLGLKYGAGGLMKCHHPDDGKTKDDYASSLALLIDASGINFMDPERPIGTGEYGTVKFGPGIKTSGVRGMDRNVNKIKDFRGRFRFNG